MAFSFTFFTMAMAFSFTFFTVAMTTAFSTVTSMCELQLFLDFLFGGHTSGQHLPLKMQIFTCQQIVEIHHYGVGLDFLDYSIQTHSVFIDHGKNSSRKDVFIVKLSVSVKQRTVQFTDMFLQIFTIRICTGYGEIKRTTFLYLQYLLLKLVEHHTHLGNKGKRTLGGCFFEQFRSTAFA